VYGTKPGDKDMPTRPTDFNSRLDFFSFEAPTHVAITPPTIINADPRYLASWPSGFDSGSVGNQGFVSVGSLLCVWMNNAAPPAINAIPTGKKILPEVRRRLASNWIESAWD